MKPKRKMIVQIITRLALGGAQQIVCELSTRLKESGEDVVVFSGLSNTGSEESVNNNIILNTIVEKGVTTKICKYFRNSISPLNDILSIYWLVKHLRILKPDVVHIHSSKAGILGRVACKLAKIDSVIYHVHGWSFSSAYGINKKLYLSMEKLFFYLTDYYIFVCKQDIDDFIRYGGNKKIKVRSSIIYPGADFTSLQDVKTNREALREDLGIGKEDFVIGSIARLDYQKNPLFFIRFAALYSKIDKNAKFLWIGDGALLDEVNALIEAEGISDRILLPGYIPNVDDYYSVFDVFSITSRYEGLPVTCIKSLAAEVPVIGFLKNGMVDLHEKFDSFFGVPFGDMDLFIQTVEKAKIFANNGANILQKESEFIRNNWSMDSMYSDVISLYDQEFL
jgi:glycosyltransferase involved in cell wall biosynthesis